MTKRVHVVADARWMQGPRAKTGVGRALLQVVPRLSHDAAISEVTLLTDARAEPVTLDLPQVALRMRGPQHSSAWLQIAAPAWLSRHRDVVFHCDWYGLPYRQPVAMTATMHDLLFEHRPEWYSRSRLLAFRAQARWAARTAACLLTPSEHVRADLTRTYGVEPSRIIVAPLSIDPVFRPDAASDRPRPAPRYVVALSGAPRRRVDVAIRAWQRLRTDVALVVVGPPPELTPCGEIRVGTLEDAEWAALLAGADALLYPTEGEGFGLPALEALASGTPVVCAAVGSLPEVLGPAAAWVDDVSEAGFARRLAEVLDDAELAAQLRAEGLARAAAHTSWDDTAAAYAQALLRAAER